MSVTQRTAPLLMRDARRLLIEDVESTIRALQSHSLADESVHDLRKQTKRMRAGLSLLRDALGETTYRYLNRSVRDAARPLTSLRDAKILCEALDGLAQRASKVRSGVSVELHRVLQQERQSSRATFSERDLDQIGTRLTKIKNRLQSLPAFRLNSASAKAALKRAYKKAYRAFKVAKQKSSNEQLHPSGPPAVGFSGQ